jgi:hypothetical protein
VKKKILELISFLMKIIQSLRKLSNQKYIYDISAFCVIQIMRCRIKKFVQKRKKRHKNKEEDFPDGDGTKNKIGDV